MKIKNLDSVTIGLFIAIYVLIAELIRYSIYNWLGSYSLATISSVLLILIIILILNFEKEKIRRLIAK